MGKETRLNFIISFLLTIPVVLYSPLGQKILGVNLPAPLPASLSFPDGGVNLLLLLLTSLVVFWSGHTLIFSPHFAPKKIILDRSLSVVIGILAVYLYSFVATVFVEWKRETFLRLRRYW